MKFRDDTYWKNLLQIVAIDSFKYKDETQEIRSAIVEVEDRIAALVKMQRREKATAKEKEL